MAALPCSATDCPYTTADTMDNAATMQDKISVLRIHADTVHGGTNTPAQNTTGPSVRAKMDPPKLHAGSDVQAWDQFIARWEIFKSTMNITTGTSMWLFNCLDEELGDAVLKANTNPAPKDMSEQTLLLSIKALAVKKESKLVHRIKLGRASQPSGVPIRNHLATLKGMARQCEYTIKCPECDAQVDFSREVVQDQIIRGLNDPGIVSELLGDVTVNRTLEEVIEFVARKEQAKIESSAVSVEQSVSAVRTTPNTPQSKAPCRHCKGPSHGPETRQVRRETCPAWSNICDKCEVKGHYSNACYKCQDCNSWGHKSMKSKWCSKSNKLKNKEKESHNESGAIFSSLAFITQLVNNSTNDLSALKLANTGTKKKGRVIPLQHHIFQDDQWIARPPASQPTCWMTATPCPIDHSDFGHPVHDHHQLHPTESSVLTDSGCQSTAIFPTLHYPTLPYFSYFPYPNLKVNLEYNFFSNIGLSCQH